MGDNASLDHIGLLSWIREFDTVQDSEEFKELGPEYQDCALQFANSRFICLSADEFFWLVKAPLQTLGAVATVFGEVLQQRMDNKVNIAATTSLALRYFARYISAAFDHMSGGIPNSDRWNFAAEALRLAVFASAGADFGVRTLMPRGIVPGSSGFFDLLHGSVDASWARQTDPGGHGFGDKVVAKRVKRLIAMKSTALEDLAFMHALQDLTRMPYVEDFYLHVAMQALVKFLLDTQELLCCAMESKYAVLQGQTTEAGRILRLVNDVCHNYCTFVLSLLFLNPSVCCAGV
jgi:hypothetical protein